MGEKVIPRPRAHGSARTGKDKQKFLRFGPLRIAIAEAHVRPGVSLAHEAGYSERRHVCRYGEARKNYQGTTVSAVFGLWGGAFYGLVRD
jgi:hypothetical protein